jgi:mannose-1-phosphate guanylyltransferase
MAAGLGTRLYPLTGLTSKPMVPILNRPVMEHLLRLLRRHGVTEIAANLHYHPDKIHAYFGDGAEFGVDLRYNLEERLLGTAGGADAFRDFLCGGTFLVMSGDGLTDIDLGAFLSAHRASGGVATMAVKEVDDPSLYGVVVHDDDLRVVGFQEKPPREEALSTLCNCGIYAFEPQIFDYIASGAFVDWAKDVFPALLEDGLPFHCWELESYWNDVGRAPRSRPASAWSRRSSWAPAASSNPAPSSSARSSSATGASWSTARCSRESSSGTARRPGGTHALPAASWVATWSCTTRPWCTRTR